jgi:4-amino-4-deoxy-L-arabinose transferase-like glycosyltransferase
VTTVEVRGADHEAPTAHPPRLSTIVARGRPSKRFLLILAAVALAGLGLRLWNTIALEHRLVGGDGLSYAISADLLRHGEGFVNPLIRSHPQAANHPPLWTSLLVLPILAGKDSLRDLQVFANLLGTASIVAVAFAGRRIAGERVGLVAAAIMALFPGAWVHERELLSETLLLLAVALTLIAAYRFVEDRSTVRAVVFAFACGVLAMIRSEQILIAVFVYGILVATLPGMDWRRRAGLLAVGGTVVALVIAPWAIYNSTRFDKPVVLTTTLGVAMAQGNCDTTYYGPRLGYYDLRCSVARNMTLPDDVRADQSRLDGELRRLSLDYIDGHTKRLPIVLLARQGRTWGFFDPLDTSDLEARWSNTPTWVHRLALYSYWVLLVPAVAGVVHLRRRRIPLAPLLAPFLVVAIAVTVTFGQPRYRAGADVPLVILAAVGIVSTGRAFTARRGGDPHARRTRRIRSRPVTSRTRG